VGEPDGGEHGIPLGRGTGKNVFDDGGGDLADDGIGGMGGIAWSCFGGALD
jgi:hypothetical protein